MTRHYLVVYAPTLFVEILGDLKKIKGDDARSRTLVANLADKVKPLDSCFTAHHRILLHANLLGHEVTMDRRPVLLGGKDLNLPGLGPGTYFEEEPERKALRRWVAGEFTAAEHVLSEAWRLSTRSIDLSKWRGAGGGLPRVRSLAELKSAAWEFCDRPGYQFEWLRLLLAEAGIGEQSSTAIFNRWVQCDMPRLSTFAPYAHYCLTVFIGFYTALANDLVGTRSTNRIDLEYLLYLPFCRVFSSGDKFHKKLAPLYLAADQDFTDREVLKADIARIQGHWEAMSEPDREEWRRKHGDYPPDWADSITNQLWEKHMLPRSQYEHVESTPEEKKQLLERLKPLFDAVERRGRDGE